MTCREKMMRDNPRLVDEDYCGGVFGCPSTTFKDAHDLCDHSESHEKLCRVCWDQECIEKPPLGVQPANIAHTARIRELCDGIKRMMEDGSIRSLNNAAMYASELQSLLEHSIGAVTCAELKDPPEV